MYSPIDYQYNSEVKSDKNKSLNLGSEYAHNCYQFDDKVSSVQRDLSLENSTDGYNSILGSSDVSNLENNRQGGMTRMKSKYSLGLNKGMARIKSSVKLFTVDSHKLPVNEDEKELGGGLVQKEI